MCGVRPLSLCRARNDHAPERDAGLSDLRGVDSDDGDESGPPVSETRLGAIVLTAAVVGWWLFLLGIVTVWR